MSISDISSQIYFSSYKSGQATSSSLKTACLSLSSSMIVLLFLMNRYGNITRFHHIPKVLYVPIPNFITLLFDILTWGIVTDIIKYLMKGNIFISDWAKCSWETMF